MGAFLKRPTDHDSAGARAKAGESAAAAGAAAGQDAAEQQEAQQQQEAEEEGEAQPQDAAAHLYDFGTFAQVRCAWRLAAGGWRLAAGGWRLAAAGVQGWLGWSLLVPALAVGSGLPGASAASCLPGPWQRDATSRLKRPAWLPRLLPACAGAHHHAGRHRRLGAAAAAGPPAHQASQHGGRRPCSCLAGWPRAAHGTLQAAERQACLAVRPAV